MRFSTALQIRDIFAHRASWLLYSFDLCERYTNDNEGLIEDLMPVPRVPEGLEDVSKYPDLVAELLRRNWSDQEVKMALGENLLRVFKAVEKVRVSFNSSGHML